MITSFLKFNIRYRDYVTTEASLPILWIHADTCCGSGEDDSDSATKIKDNNDPQFDDLSMRLPKIEEIFVVSNEIGKNILFAHLSANLLWIFNQFILPNLPRLED